jgi:hypothetical protein
MGIRPNSPEIVFNWPNFLVIRAKSAEFARFRPNFRKIIGTEHHCSYLILKNEFLILQHLS